LVFSNENVAVIEYHTPFENFPELRIPRLHRVYYSIEHDPYFVNQWLRANCRHNHYSAPNWSIESDRCFIEFEDSEDAVLFALTWS
jgi:hypothetical protein